jgi:diacylglycerol kinase family enzyme
VPLTPNVLLLVNPFASRVDDQVVQGVEGALSVVARVETVRTEARGHATQLAAATEADAVIVLGGDGVANEALNGLGDVLFGALPGGGTSVLSRALGLPRSPVAAADRIAHALAAGRTRRISLGRANGRRFAFAAGVGLDAEAVRRVEALGRSSSGRRPGDLRFAWTIIRLLGKSRFTLEPVLEVDGLGRGAFALVANCDPYTYAGSLALHVAPQARFELGLDVVAPRRLSVRALPRFAAYVLRGRGQERAHDILYAHDLDRITIVCDGALPLQLDGEDVGDVGEVVLEAERDAVSVLA